MWAVLPIILALAGLAALIYFGMGSYKAIMWWLLLSPDYLLFLGLTWVYTLDYMSWQGMAKLGQYAWTIDAMLLVGVVYFILNSVLYGKSTRLYKIVSALVILACSLYIMLVPVTDFVEGIGPKPANNLSTSQMVYIGIAVVIAAVTWFMRQSTMAKLDLTLQDKAAS